MCKHLVHVFSLTVLIFISTPAYLQQIKVKAELAWRPCQQEFHLIEFSEYAMLDKSLNFAHEPVAEIDFFQGSMIKKKKKCSKPEEIQSKRASFSKFYFYSLTLRTCPLHLD